MYNDTTGFKQNNPGNLRGEGIAWQGKTGMNKGFSVFQDRVYGVRAIYIDLQNKFRAGKDTITKIISTYAPPIENDTNHYIKTVEKLTGVPKDTQMLPTLPVLRKIVKAIILHEIGYKIPESELLEAENLISEKKK